MEKTKEETEFKKSFRLNPIDREKYKEKRYKQMTLTQMEHIFPPQSPDSSARNQTSEHSVQFISNNPPPDTPSNITETTATVSTTAEVSYHFKDFVPGELVEVSVNEEEEFVKIKAPRLHYGEPPRRGFLTQHVYMNCKCPEPNYWDQTTVPLAGFHE